MSTDDPLTRSNLDGSQRARNQRLADEVVARRAYDELPLWRKLRTPAPPGCRWVSRGPGRWWR
jgi:hypothetical protein